MTWIDATNTCIWISLNRPNRPESGDLSLSSWRTNPDGDLTGTEYPKQQPGKQTWVGQSLVIDLEFPGSRCQSVVI